MTAREDRRRFLIWRRRANRRALRLQVFAGYGGACAWCGETRPDALSLDHVNGGGSEHRRITKDTYRWALENGCPPTLQPLCATCHALKNAGYKSPQEVEREVEQAREAAQEIGREAW